MGCVLILVGFCGQGSGDIHCSLARHRGALLQVRSSRICVPVQMASSPMTTLSIGGVSPGNGNGVREHHSYETILRLKSWNQDLELISTDHLQSGNAPVEMAVSNGFRSGSHNSSNGLKRKRSELPGAHSTPLYDGGESRMGLGLGLGQVDDSSSMDEDSGVVLGLGQSDTRNYSGNMSGSANFCGSLGGDETVHSGNAMSEMLLARSQGMNRTEPGVLLRLNSMGDLQSGAPGMGGSGWPGDGQQYNGNAERRVGSHLGLAPSRTGYVDMTDSTNGRKFGSDGGLLLGLGQGAKAQSGNGAPFPVVDEGSSTARLTSGGYMPSLLMGSQIYPTVASDRQRSDFRGKERMDEGLVEHDLLFNLRASASGGTTSTSGASGSDRAPKVCKFRGCGKGPRGASGLCIAHGGGRRLVPILNSEPFCFKSSVVGPSSRELFQILSCFASTFLHMVFSPAEKLQQQVQFNFQSFGFLTCPRYHSDSTHLTSCTQFLRHCTLELYTA